MKKFKGLSFIAVIGVLIVILIGTFYYKNKSNDDFSDVYTGYISIEPEDLKDNTFLVDKAEWISYLNRQRMHELGLTRDDMANGYYIHDVDSVKTPITVNEKTVYQFYNLNQVHSKDESQDENEREYTTTDKSEFINILKSYKDSGKRTQPLFWIEIQDGVVVKIEEQPIY